MTTTQTISPPTARFARDLGEVRKEVLARVEAILPALADAAADAEAQRDLTPESFAALVDSGALRLFAPQRAGGYEAGYRTYVESTVLLARACGSSAWLSFILNHGDWQTGQMSAAVQERVWAGNSASAKVAVPLAPMPGWRAERHDGGTTISGDWPYSSGSSHASWALIGFPLLDDDGSQTDSMIGLINTSGIPVRATADAIDAQALTARPFPAIERARFAMRSAQAHSMCREGVDLLLDVQGAGAFALNNPLQRIWRDMHVASRHGLSVPGMKQELYGRALLGADEQQMTPIR